LRVLVWLNPAIAPVSRDRAARDGISFWVRVTRRKKGAIFWRVVSTIFVSQGRPSITWGTQK